MSSPAIEGWISSHGAKGSTPLPAFRYRPGFIPSKHVQLIPALPNHPWAMI
ncbi:MAG: hypothetical protein M1388_01565 [Thaumarchaeota archaeon]|nr:hypothetical protein [Nitrososphaerota archaeon]